MHQYYARGLCASLAAIVSTTALIAAEPAAAPAPEKPWYAKLIPLSNQSPTAPAPVLTPKPLNVGPIDSAILADALKAEIDACQRRLDVCLKLRQIALAKGDEKLANQADELEKQITTLYNARVARLGVKVPGLPTQETTTPVRQFREVKP